MGEQGFWDDQDRAAKVSAEHARVGRRLAAYRELESGIDDLEALEELAEEDPSIAEELAEQRTGLEARLAQLEEQRLFAGPYDAGDAVVSVHAGAGGTDSQDWAEMLLRLELRFAERREFAAELKEASAGEEAGIKVRDVRGSRRERLRLSTRPRRGSTGWCGSLPSTPPREGTPPLPSSRSRRSSTKRSRSRSTTPTCRSTPTAPRAQAAST
jgi:Protein chain release factor A